MSSSIGYLLGAGSGIDTNALIDSLVSATRTPKESALKKRETSNTAKISALAEASNAISSFSTALSTLISGGSLYTQPTVSDSSVLMAKALPGARLGGYSAQIEVKQIAQSQTLHSEPLSGADAPVGEGTLTLTTASGSKDIVIGAGNNSLEGLAQAINDSNSGVTATIITSGGEARLSLKGATGEAKAFTLSVAAGTTSGLERFAFGPSISGGLTQSQAAKDAILVLDGVEVTRGTNSISDLIPGMQLDLKKAAAGTQVTIGSERPIGAMRQAVYDFVDAYNELNSMLNELAGAGQSGQAAGPLYNDVGIRDMRRQLAALPSTILRSGTGPQTLTEIGVATNRDGSLSVRASVLDEMLVENPDAVEGLFNPGQHSSDPSITITSAIGKVKPGTYTLTDVLPAANGEDASGKIGGVAFKSAGDFLIAPAGSGAVGLVVKVSGAVSEATITIDAGLGGALQAIKDALTGLNGPLSTSNTRLQDEAEEIADDRDAMERRMEAYRSQLVKSYTAMERQVSVFKATQSYLDQQIKAWNRSND